MSEYLHPASEQHIRRSLYRSLLHPLGQRLPSTLTHFVDVEIRNDPIPLVDFRLDFGQISPDPFRPPFVAVPNVSATLHQPVAAFPPFSIKCRKDGFEVSGLSDATIRDQLSEDGAVFNTETGSRTMMWTRCVCCVPNYTDPASGEGWYRVVTRVKDCPLLGGQRGNDPLSSLRYVPRRDPAPSTLTT